MFKKSYWLLVVAVFLLGLLALGGCGQQKAAEQPSPQEEGTQGGEGSEKLKVALVLPGPINDNGWNATAYEGLKAMEQELGAEVSYTENVSQSDQEEIMRGYAEQGYDIIIAHGFQFEGAAQKVAPQFTESIFVINNGSVAKDNVCSLVVDNYQIGFLQGAVAAILSKSNKVAAIGGEEMPPIRETLDGFVDGAKYVNPNIDVKTAMTGSFSDVAKMKEMTLSLIDQGCDVVMGDANQASLGAIQAAQERKVLAIGYGADLNGVAPDTVVTSVVQSWAQAMVAFGKIVQEGQYEPKIYYMGVKEGAVYLAPFHGFEDKLSAEVKEKINQVVEDVKSGKAGIKPDR
ncbi:BMP family protein [Thermanaeromonas sp. C210]|uniref:BMP family protein n=1 Tax=Thermanaeromonas sp. C210 TaxID=2731925 RepID=UPI00155D06D7|nr:BMP family protein [Thermanaeromonas sp. C210]GFN22850.1 BMP family ABC transporter substrate-binding protein [Thermanaeromonas sp. C210]